MSLESARRLYELQKWELAETIATAEESLEMSRRWKEIYVFTPTQLRDLEWDIEHAEKDIAFYSRQLEQMEGKINVPVRPKDEGLAILRAITLVPSCVYPV